MRFVNALLLSCTVSKQNKEEFLVPDFFPHLTILVGIDVNV